MTRHIAGVVLLALALGAAPSWARAQAPLAQVPDPPAGEGAAAATLDGHLGGVVADEAGDPLAGVVVSALGMVTAFAVTDDDGRFAFRDLPAGPYLVRAHLKGYTPPRAREVQVVAAGRAVSNFVLGPQADGDAAAPEVLAAGVGPAEVAPVDKAVEVSAEEAERAWRLRHLRRSILKDADPGVILARGGDGFGEGAAEFGRAVLSAPARLAASLFSDPAVNAEINFLTTTSFARPQDLFSGDAGLPRGVAYIALEVPDADALWSVEGALTQGDLASWILAGSYASRGDGAHQYEVGMSYSMQRYAGGNADALASMGDGSRNIGAVYGQDTWRLGRSLAVDYGARYAVYDYLTSSRGLLSPRAGVTLTPVPGDSLEVRASVSRDAVAPGAAEFLPPTSGLLLPPERTFSSLVAEAGFLPERVTSMEVEATRELPGAFLVGVRAFRQSVDDQVMTVFGLEGAPGAGAAIGHYYVASAGDVDANGVGVRVSHALPVGLTGTVNYTVTDAAWVRQTGATPAGQPLTGVRPMQERIHDVTASVQGEVSATATRVFLVYRVNTALAVPGESGAGRRFDLRVNQALPFLDFTSAQWEMLVAVRNVFHTSGTDVSLYDELLVVKPPKQIVGGLTVRF